MRGKQSAQSTWFAAIERKVNLRQQFSMDDFGEQNGFRVRNKLVRKLVRNTQREWLNALSC